MLSLIVRQLEVCKLYSTVSSVIWQDIKCVQICEYQCIMSGPHKKDSTIYTPLLNDMNSKANLFILTVDCKHLALRSKINMRHLDIT